MLLLAGLSLLSLPVFAGDSLVVSGELPFQGNCTAPGMPSPEMAKNTLDPKISVLSCIGISNAPLNFRFESGVGEACLYIDNLTTFEVFFVPLKTFEEWKHFREATQPGSGSLHKRVALTYGCRATQAYDTCDGKVSLLDARNGTVHSAKAGNKSLVYTCVASTGCGIWGLTSQEGECPAKGECGAAHMAPHLSIPVTDLCLKGEPTEVTGEGPWTWSCLGTSGGMAAPCMGELDAPPEE
jgi:hypothetical protein